MKSDSIRTRFDAILRDNIRRLLDTMPEAASLPFDIVTITSLILLVEKEKELEAFPRTDSERYFQSSLVEDLSQTGLTMDEDSMGSVQNLQRMGFVTIDPNGLLVPRESTAKLAAVLDNLFPGMPGINLVAYFLQTVDEAASGRKEIDQAVRQFEQTLISRGIPLSKSNQPRGKAVEPADGGKPTEKIDLSRRISSLERLRRIGASPNSRSAGVSSVRPVTGFQRVDVVSLFPTPASSPDPGSAQNISLASAEPRDLGEDTIEPIDRGDPAGEASDPIAAAEPSGEISEAVAQAAPYIDRGESSFAGKDAGAAPFGLASDPAEPDRIDPIEPVEDRAETSVQGSGTPEASIEDRPLPVAAESEEITGDEPERTSDFEAAPATGEEIVDLQVQQFQQALAMTCPLCREGVVHPSKTDKGKVYYSCKNGDCNFISWGKPYHFACPYCRNPFLVEYSSHDGLAGLKCPKATCNYRQEHLNSPASGSAPSTISPEPGTAPKKGKILVRKRLVRKKR